MPIKEFAANAVLEKAFAAHTSAFIILAALLTGNPMQTFIIYFERTYKLRFVYNLLGFVSFLYKSKQVMAVSDYFAV